MKVIPPVTITDSILSSSTVAERAAGETEWNAATNYSVGTEVIRTQTHRTYKNLIAGVDAGTPETTPARWLDVGATIRWKMFDLYRNTETTQASSPLTVVLTPSIRISSLALLGVIADSIHVTMVASAVTVYDQTFNLSTRNTVNYTDYFFGVFGNTPAIIIQDLPLYLNSTITITFTKASGTIKVGGCVIGNYIDLGYTEASAESDVLNFSKVERDLSGTATLIPKRSVPKTIQNCLIDKSAVNKVRDVREVLNAVPAVWFGIDSSTNEYFEALLILGIYKRFSINLTDTEHAMIALEIEEI